MCDGVDNCPGKEDEDQKKCIKLEIKNSRQTFSPSDRNSTIEQTTKSCKFVIFK